MKRIQVYIVFIFLFLVLGYVVFTFVREFGLFEERSAGKEEKQQFEFNLAKALDLKLISRDRDYQSRYLNIYNDTIVGLYHNKIKDREYQYYFIRSIKNPHHKVEFNNPTLRYPSISSIDYLKDGCLYFGEYGGGKMQVLSSDGKLKAYFKKYEDTLFYATKVMPYKSKIAIASFNGVYVFDMKSQQLVWKHKYKNDSPMQGLSAVIDDNLVFTESIVDSLKSKTYTVVTCLDLNKSEVKWKKIIENDTDYLYGLEFIPYYHLYHDSGNVIITQARACYAVDLKSGNIKGRVPWEWKGDPPGFSLGPRIAVENNRLYYFNQQELLCIDMTTNKKIWVLKNVSLVGLYKKFVVGKTVGDKFYVIINKLTGKVLVRVAKPKNNYSDLSFIGKYILINRQSIYK